MAANLFPAFIKLAGRACLVVGAGTIAETKITSLLDAGARVTVVAPEATLVARELAASGQISWHSRVFAAGDLDGVFLVVAATSHGDVNRAVYLEAQARGILCNAVDDPPNCDFFFPAVVRRGPLQIAISTSGESPALAQRLRQEMEKGLDVTFGDWVRAVGAGRREILATLPASEERKQFLHGLASAEAFDSWKATKEIKREEVAEPNAKTAIREICVPGAAEGKAFLVGAGPGDPELLTLKAYALLQRADVVLHDDLVPAAIVSLAGKGAQVVNVGKRCGAKGISQAEINFLMIEHARLGRNVVRLKSGDPAVFGRLAEEIDALADANVAYEIVPGITAAMAATASLGISLTDRRKSARIVIVSGHRARAGSGEQRIRNDWTGLAHEDATLVVYMPGRQLAGLRNELLEAGLAADTPAAIISRVSSPRQREWLTTLGKLDSLPAVEAPSLLLIGRTLGRARLTSGVENRVPIFAGAEWQSVLALVESEIAAESSEVHFERSIAP